MDPMANLIDIIIVNYNSTDFLLKSLASIHDALNGIPVKLFIEDNASKDGIERIKKKYSHATVSYNRRNMGFAQAVNQAVKKSSAPFILLLNPDAIVRNGFFDALVGYMKKNPDVGISAPRILNPDQSVQGSARTFPTLLTGLFGRTTILSSLFPNNRFTRGNIATIDSDGISPMPVDWVSGACMLLRRKAIDDIGLMDEQFFLYWEDADWCRRMWKNGWKVIYFPKAHVVHYVGKSSDSCHIKSRFEFHKSSYRLFAKYTEWPLVKPFAAFVLAFRFCMLSLLFLLRQPGTVLKKFEREKAQTRSLSKKIKILRIISRLNIGGPAIHVQVLTKELNHDKFDSMLIIGTVSPNEGDMRYIFDSIDSKIVYVPELGREINFAKDIQALIAIFKILLREKPHIVETHMAKAGFSGRLAVFFYNMIYRQKIICMHTFHGHVFDGYFSKSKSFVFIYLERMIAKYTDIIISLSKTQKHEFAEEYRIAPAKKIKTVELGFNLKPFLGSRLLRGKFRRKLKIDDASILVGIVGRLVSIKNHKMFFEAAKIFIQQNPNLSIVFVIVGDGALRGDLETYCRSHDLSDHVKFCGWIKDIESVYADLDVLALTSINEGTPVSIIEAMASSVPVIATNAGGVMDMLGPAMKKTSDNGFKICERGVLCRKNDAIGFSKGLKWLIDNKTSAKGEMVNSARAFVKERYTYKRLIADMEKLYTGLVQ